MDPVASFLGAGKMPGMESLGEHASRQQMEQVGQEFESVFLSMMLKEMRNSLDGGGFFGEESSDTYGGMFDMFIGQHLASSRPLGIADLLLEQYGYSAYQSQRSLLAEENVSPPEHPVSITA
jgi:peptidoglycan hydrolase FlgJ